MKKIPWINEGSVGFFEYDVVVYGFQLVARTKEDLQKEVFHLLTNQNYDRVNDKIREITMEEIASMSIKEQCSVKIPELIHERNNNSEYRAIIKQQMLDNGEILPDDISIEELDYNFREYTQEEVNEVTDFVTNYPSVTQVELEDIYLRENSENAHYDIYKEKVRNAQTNIENYESSLEISELIVQLYEEKLALEEQVISTTETVVEMYEQLNNNN